MTTAKRLRTPLGAAAGLLSAAAGGGASMIVSVIVGGAPTPITAVGSRVIDATPGAVKDWAVKNLGTNDKPFLLTGIFTAIAVLAAITGVIAWRSRRAALAPTAILGLVGLAAAYADPTTLVGTFAKVAPAIVAVLVSVGFLHLFTRHWTTAGQSAGQAAGAPAGESESLVAVGAGSTAGSASTVSQRRRATTPLTTTVSGAYNKNANFVGTLNAGQLTAFARVDTAFKALPKKTLATLAEPKNAALLQQILTYHLVSGQIAPADIAGMQKTVEGKDVAGSGNNIKVNGANVICGGVKTAKATVYLIDGVLSPPDMPAM